MPEQPDSPTSLDRIRWSNGSTDDDDDGSFDEKRYEAQLEREDDPQRLSLLRRWLAVATISISAHFVTFASSAAVFSLRGVRDSFHVGQEVATLSISLFVIGLGIGPLFAGPISEIYGRNIVYRMSFALFFVFSFPIAFAPNIGIFLMFRFATGFCGAAFLTVSGGSVSDMFPNATVGTPMAVYTVSSFLGPETGLLFSGFINENVSWRWTYYALIIWSFLQAVALVCFVPETYAPVILKWKAQRLRKSGGNKRYYAPLEKADISLGRSIFVSCYKPFQLLSDHMIFLINLWCALVLGILYLTFEVFPIIFIGKHNFTKQMTGLTFLGIAFGNLIGLATTPYWNRRYRLFLEKNGDPPPEFRLVMGQIGGVLVSISLFCLAFTTYKDVHWIAPIIASVPFGTGIYFVYSSSFTYLVVAYRPIAASAMASNSAMRSSFAAAFPLFASQMYHRLGTVGATVLIAGLATAMAPLPFVFYHVGEKLRAKSKFAV
ncbi:MFS general substrate transporter [Russula ochroleuca]|uniref:MFS general substrate transporter n=1 Tax=Russula ochroleuca TaxID=152965 RepID=A0A9P5TDS9_9AGAM|nr:MFS general substrate transporter [Russula ochroleuca]